jgi:hypothetical protein
MSVPSSWPMPFVLDPNNLAVDAVTTFCVSVLLAVMINAEAQAFVSTFLGDSRVDAKDRLHFNAFLHLDILGTICYLVGGFGWPRTLDIDASKFKHPRLYLVLSRAAGPVANLVLASIGGSMVMVFNFFDYNPRVFLMVIGVNVTTAVYHLLPIPPLFMGSVVTELMPPEDVKTRSTFRLAGPFLIVALALLDRILPHGLISPYLNPLIKAVFPFMASY